MLKRAKILVFVAMLILYINLASAVQPWGWYHMEGTGDATDSSDSGHTIPQNGTVPSATGLLNNARGAYSTANHFVSDDFTLFNDADDMSFSMWVQVDTAVDSTNYAIMLGDPNIAGEFVCYIAIESTPDIKLDCFEAGVGGGAVVSKVVTGGVGDWYHIAVTYKGSNKTATLYVNGTDAGSDTIDTGANTKGSRMMIGYREPGLEADDIIVDEVQIYNYTISAVNVTTLYNNHAGTESYLGEPSDTTAPTASVAYNSSPSYRYQNTTINITWTDADNNVDNISIWHNESGSWVQAYNVTGIGASPSTASFNVNITTRVGGEFFSWNSTGCDDQGNCGNSDTYLITVTNTAPPQVTAWTSPNATDYNSTSNMIFNWTSVADADGDIVYYQIYMNVTSYYDVVYNGTDSNWTSNLTASRRYEYLVGVYDGEGYGANSTSRNITFLFDTAPPDMEIISPLNNTADTDGIVSFLINATDGTTVSNCSLYINGVLNTTNTSVNSGEIQNYTIHLPDNSYYWRFSCYDGINSNQTQEYNLTVDRQFKELTQTCSYSSSTGDSTINRQYACTGWAVFPLLGTHTIRSVMPISSLPEYSARGGESFSINVTTSSSQKTSDSTNVYITGVYSPNATGNNTFKVIYNWHTQAGSTSGSSSSSSSSEPSYDEIISIDSIIPDDIGSNITETSTLDKIVSNFISTRVSLLGGRFEYTQFKSFIVGIKTPSTWEEGIENRVFLRIVHNNGTKLSPSLITLILKDKDDNIIDYSTSVSRNSEGNYYSALEAPSGSVEGIYYLFASVKTDKDIGVVTKEISVIKQRFNWYSLSDWKEKVIGLFRLLFNRQ